MLNGLVLAGLLLALGISAAVLFQRPSAPPELAIGALTHVFQMLCVVPPTVLLFTLMVKGRSDDDAGDRGFLLASGLLTGAFLVNEVFRVHVHLMTLGIAKAVVVAVAAVALLAYGFGFRRRLSSGPGVFAIVGFTTLIVGVVIDSLRLTDETLTDTLEGIPKVISQVNLTAFYCLVCRAQLRPSCGAGE